jgi:hypothetical protein
MLKLRVVGAWYSVQILLPRWISVPADELFARARRWRGDIRIEHRQLDRMTIEIPAEDLSLRAMIFLVPPESYAGALEDALRWSPTWHEPWEITAARCPASLVVALNAESPINHASMLLAFLAILDATLFSLDDADRDASVLHWIPSQQLMTYAHYLDLRTQLGPCGPAVNIRIANITGRPGELLADTIGLAELGLPDLQIVFADRDPAEVILRLRLLVRSMFVGEHLGCSWIEEAALVPPERDALTLQLE